MKTIVKEKKKYFFCNFCGNFFSNNGTVEVPERRANFSIIDEKDISYIERCKQCKK